MYRLCCLYNQDESYWPQNWPYKYKEIYYRLWTVWFASMLIGNYYYVHNLWLFVGMEHVLLFLFRYEHICIHY